MLCVDQMKVHVISYCNAAAEVVCALGGLCIQHAQGPVATDLSKSTLQAANLFASTSMSGQQLDCLLCMPWKQASPAVSHPTLQHSPVPARSQAKISSLLIQSASTVLGFPELTPAGFSSRQGSSGVVHTALQDSSSLVQAAAAAVLPVLVANAAEAVKGSTRGRPSVGIRLLQKGLDSLSGLLHHEGAESSLVKTPLAFAVGGLVSMQAIIDHRTMALCKTAQSLVMTYQNSNGSRRSSSSNASSGASTTRNERDFFCNNSISGLDCWPLDQRNYKELPVTAHGGALVPLKALRTFTDALLFCKEAEPKQSSHGLHKVPQNAVRLSAIKTVLALCNANQFSGSRPVQLALNVLQKYPLLVLTVQAIRRCCNGSFTRLNKLASD